MISFFKSLTGVDLKKKKENENNDLNSSRSLDYSKNIDNDSSCVNPSVSLNDEKKNTPNKNVEIK